MRRTRASTKASSEASEPPVKMAKQTKKVEDEEEQAPEASSIYEFSAKKLSGEEYNFKDLKGHVCLIVNVASRCGHTKLHYEQLVELHKKYSKDKSLKILAFPCNQFGKQEPGDAEKIRAFLDKRDVEFEVFEKVDVNGAKAHPLWTYLKSKISGPKDKKDVTWNFTKFIVDKEGQVVERHQPSVKPLTLVSSLEKYW